MKSFRSFVIQGVSLLSFLLFYLSASTQDTLKVMYYNVLKYPGSTAERVQYFRTICHYTLPDMILINELISDAGANILLNDGLNTWGMQKYQKAAFTNGTDTDNMLFYNSEKLTLYSQDTIGTVLRLINEYVLFYNSPELVNGADTVFLYFYSAHLKAGNLVANRHQRRDEVMAFKDHIAAKGYPENLFFGGDMNFHSAFTEPAYDSIVNSPVYSLIDPLPAGAWRDNEDFAYLHTQSTRTVQFGGGASGGMDDRFDFIFFSPDVNTGENGVKYIPESCIAFGNDGLRLNKSLLDPPVNQLIPDSVNQALYYMSDHLPVICLIEIDQGRRDTVKLDLKVYLEGAFKDNSMASSLYEFLPEDQPYNQSPWYYNKSVTVDPDNLIEAIDWCIVELRSTPGTAVDALQVTPSVTFACLIMNDGSIISPLDGSMPSYLDTIPDNIFIAIRHRNHLDILASTPSLPVNGIIEHDFTTSATVVYGGVAGYSELIPGIWGMVAGDADGNGIIDINDLQMEWNTQGGENGYLSGDINFDNQVNNLDKNQYIIKNLLKHSPLTF